VPAEAPRLVIAVVVDEPGINHYGGTAAGPVFRRLGQQALRHLRVPAHGRGQALGEHEAREQRHRREARRAAREARIAAREAGAGAPAEERAPTDVTVAVVAPRAPGPGEIAVPDLRGMSVRQAVVALTGASLVPELRGSGVVASQEPA